MKLSLNVKRIFDAHIVEILKEMHIHGSLSFTASFIYVILQIMPESWHPNLSRIDNDNFLLQLPSIDIRFSVWRLVVFDNVLMLYHYFMKQKHSKLMILELEIVIKWQWTLINISTMYIDSLCKTIDNRTTLKHITRVLVRQCVMHYIYIMEPQKLSPPASKLYILWNIWESICCKTQHI